jgi:iron-sulfur cluster repair protein YtfE (RIC family)
MNPITPDMQILDIVAQYPAAQKVLTRYGDDIGVCICCQALFEALSAVADKYGLDLDQMLYDLNSACKPEHPGA